MACIRIAFVDATFVMVAILASGSAMAQEGDSPKPNYDEQVRGIFREHCFSCHNQNQAKSDLALDSFAAVMQGGASGGVIEPGDPDSSRLWKLVSHEESPSMPPEQDKLADEKLAVIRAWIAAGALENNGSMAKVKEKPKLELNVAAGFARPVGPPPMPEGLSHEPVTYTPKAQAITALAASPWAPLVAIGGQRQIALYHSDTGELLGLLPFPEGIPHVIKFSRSGSLLLAGGGRAAQRGLVVVFDVRTGKRVFELGDELDVALAADINEDHTQIAMGGPGRVVRVYSTADGSLVHEIKKHTDWIYSVEFSPDGVMLATCDRTGGLFVWETETGREYQNLKGHTAAVTDVSWRGDSNVLATCSEDTTVKLWEMEAGGMIKSWGAHGGGVASIEYTHDGRLVTNGRDRQAKVWDQDGNQIKAFDAFSDLGLEAVFTHDGARVVAGDWSGEVRMYEVGDAKLIANLPPNPPTLAMVAQNAEVVLASAEDAQRAADEGLAAARAELEAKASLLVATTESLTTSQREAANLAAKELVARQLVKVREAAVATARADRDAAADDSAKTAAATVLSQVESELQTATSALSACQDEVLACSQKVTELQATADAATKEKATAEQAALQKEQEAASAGAAVEQARDRRARAAAAMQPTVPQMAQAG